jgi:lipopolysaccharide export system protein LptA
MLYFMKFVACIIFPVILAGNASLFAQSTINKPTDDTLQEIEILSATKRLTFKTINDTTKLTIITGDVKLKQGNTLFYCDSCVINNNTNVFEAWGKVHINDSDTTNIYANHLRYLIKPKLAYLDGNVKLTDGKGILTTPDLEYDMETNIGIYKHGGKVVNKKSVLTSQEGWYFADMHDIYFKKNVVLKDPAYDIITDSLIYNTQSQTTRFISMTTITDSSGRIIKTREGYYNQQTGKAEFGQRPTIIDPKGEIEITADNIKSDDSLGISQATGNAIIFDKKNKTTIIAGIIFRNKKTEAIMAVQKPLMIVVQDNDTIYITADTLFSARLTDLYASRSLGLPMTAIDSNSLHDTSASIHDTVAIKNLKDTSGNEIIRNDTISIQQNAIKDQAKDSVNNNSKNADTVSPKKPVSSDRFKNLITQNPAKTDTTHPAKPGRPGIYKDSVLIRTTKGMKMVALNEKDSTNRYFEAYRHVRIFNDSLQAVGDSMFYSFKDSVFRLYYDPAVWAKESQITGDTILLYTKNKKPDKIEAFEKSFMVNKLDTQAFNQIKATRMDGYFTDGNIDSVRAKGYAECIYYLQNEDSAYTGINESKSDIMDIYFRNKGLFKVVFRSSVTGTLWPIRQKSPSEMRLQNFRWLEKRRPKTKLEMYE